MTIALYTNIVSPHQLPFARELVRRVGAANYRYVYAEPFHAERAKMGWGNETEPWLVSEHERPAEARQWMETCDVLICCLRDLDLVEHRCRKGLLTFYCSERWFKPPIGRLRLLVPAYRRMALRFRALVAAYPNFRLLPIGVHARHDFVRFGIAPEKMTTWGYFVAPSKGERSDSRSAAARAGGRALRVLWVGRLLALKRIDTLLKASAAAAKKVPLELTVVGDGPERPRLEKLAQRLFANSPGVFHFEHSVSIAHVRELMEENDVYVLSSNAYEGWGAVVSEALEEGMSVLGTCEAGSCATILPRERLFRCGDAQALTQLLTDEYAGALPPCSIVGWTAHDAADRFLALCQPLPCGG